MKKGIVRNIIGIFFIVVGVAGIFTGDFLAGILMTLFGVSFLPSFYEKTKLMKYKHIQVILPIVLFLVMGSAMPSDNTEGNNLTNIVSANIEDISVVKITDLVFNEANIEIDIKETKDIFLKINPQNATFDELKFNSTNNEIAKFEKNIEKSNDNQIYVRIQPVSEGECEVYAISDNIESNRIKVTIIDNERIEKEKQIKEEQSKKEAEEQAKKQAEEKAKKDAEEKSKQQQTTTTQKSTSSSNSQSTSNNSKGKTVYRTPSGKRYHFDPDCGGKNSRVTTLDEAKSAGLTPCKKCAN